MYPTQTKRKNKGKQEECEKILIYRKCATGHTAILALNKYLKEYSMNYSHFNVHCNEMSSVNNVRTVDVQVHTFILKQRINRLGYH